jgi:hypothetical protein
MAAHPARSTLITICFNWAKGEMLFTHLDPWEGLLARVSGVSVRHLELRVRLALFWLTERPDIHEGDGIDTDLL